MTTTGEGIMLATDALAATAAKLVTPSPGDERAVAGSSPEQAKGPQRAPRCRCDHPLVTEERRPHAFRCVLCSRGVLRA
jgi:hypothetical protein